MIAPLIGGLITGGISLLGGLFGRSDAKKQQKADKQAIAAANAANAYQAELTRLRAREAAKLPIVTKNEPTVVKDRSTQTTTSTGSVDMAGFMKAAEDNGFNPLTFLRSGALSAFAKTVVNTINGGEITTTGGGTAVYNAHAMDAALAGGGSGSGAPAMPVMSSVNVPGVGSIVANSLGAGFNQYLNLDAQARQEKMQAAYLHGQLTGAQRSGSMVGGRSFYTPSSVSSGGSVTKAGNAALTSSQFGKGKKYSAPGDIIFVGGVPIRTNANTSDADVFEQRYSDAGGWLGGAAALANDYYINADPQSKALMDFMSETPGVAGKRMVDYYSGALSRTTLRIKEIPQIGADYIKSISASPTNPGKTWSDLAKDWGLSSW